jgi:peptidoglycan L-alanyl-D-glutamate endopeptidase CwlK
MRQWGKDSYKVYQELDPRLQRVVTRVRDEVADISLICGFRDQHEQNSLFDAGMSKLRWPDGKHNTFPSKAVDLQPYPRPNTERRLEAALSYIAGAALQIGKEEGITLRWGGDWDSDGSLADQKWFDMFHLEIVNEIPDRPDS